MQTVVPNRAIPRAERHDAIVAQVERWPGSNLRQVARATLIPLSTTARILDQLVEQGRVRLEGDGGTNHYYPIGQRLHKRERVALRILAKPRPRAILEAILADPGIRHVDLAAKIDLPPPTLTYYLKAMVEEQLVAVRKAGAARHYTAKNPAMLRTALERTTGGFSPEIA